MKMKISQWKTFIRVYVCMYANDRLLLMDSDCFLCVFLCDNLIHSFIYYQFICIFEYWKQNKTTKKQTKRKKFKNFSFFCFRSEFCFSLMSHGVVEDGQLNIWFFSDYEQRNVVFAFKILPSLRPMNSFDFNFFLDENLVSTFINNE